MQRGGMQAAGQTTPRNASKVMRRAVPFEELVCASKLSEAPRPSSDSSDAGRGTPAWCISRETILDVSGCLAASVEHTDRPSINMRSLLHAPRKDVDRPTLNSFHELSLYWVADARSFKSWKTLILALQLELPNVNTRPIFRVSHYWVSQHTWLSRANHRMRGFSCTSS